MSIFTNCPRCGRDLRDVEEHSHWVRDNRPGAPRGAMRLVRIK